ncbi:hypothetical protein KP509_25G012300 [Ceratopteris richardii]|uniref:Uncharacterized protein n=1 Tax=Ceratopteris richardii TaxID=49495 RepID=A0A8T2RQR3_CERRI|nr:hypothetical protein KP509_25G012300 [Ceratopteris richardii]
MYKGRGSTRKQLNEGSLHDAKPQLENKQINRLEKEVNLMDYQGGFSQFEGMDGNKSPKVYSTRKKTTLKAMTLAKKITRIVKVLFCYSIQWCENLCQESWNPKRLGSSRVLME